MYCSIQVVREISGYTRNFRVLALSATPGDNPEVNNRILYHSFEMLTLKLVQLQLPLSTVFLEWIIWLGL